MVYLAVSMSARGASQPKQSECYMAVGRCCVFCNMARAYAACGTQGVSLPAAGLFGGERGSDGALRHRFRVHCSRSRARRRAIKQSQAYSVVCFHEWIPLPPSQQPDGSRHHPTVF